MKKIMFMKSKDQLIRTAQPTFKDKAFASKYATGRQVKGDLSHQGHPVTEALYSEFVQDKLIFQNSWKNDVVADLDIEPNICVISSIELVSHLLDQGIDPSRIAFKSTSKWKYQEAIAMGIDEQNVSMLQYKSGELMVKSSLENNLRQNPRVQGLYDQIIMNPPYELTEDFLKLSDQLLKPNGQTAVICDAKRFKDIDWSYVKEYQYIHGAFTGVQLNMCIAIIDKQKQEECLLIDLNNKKLSVKPEDIRTMPTEDLSVWTKVNDVLKQGYEGYFNFVNGGQLHNREVVEVRSGIEFLPTVGKTDEPIITKTISKSNLSKVTGGDKPWVVVGADYTTTAIGPMKIKPVDVYIGNRVYGIPCKSETEAKKVIKHLETDAVKNFVAGLKVTAKNSKEVFSRIPRHDESKKWMASFE